MQQQEKLGFLCSFVARLMMKFLGFGLGILLFWAIGRVWIIPTWSTPVNLALIKEWDWKMFTYAAIGLGAFSLIWPVFVFLTRKYDNATLLAGVADIANEGRN